MVSNVLSMISLISAILGCRLLFYPLLKKWMTVKLLLKYIDISTGSVSKMSFTITAEIHARSLVNFYCQYADRRMDLKFIPRVGERERAIRQFVIVKNKSMSVFNAPVLLLTMNFVITLSR